MQQIDLSTTKLTVLQEKVLIELDKTSNSQFICKKLNIKPISLSKTTQALQDRELIYNNQLTDKGKKMVHYLNFRNETISLFLKKHSIEETPEIYRQLGNLDFRIIIALRNLLY